MNKSPPWTIGLRLSHTHGRRKGGQGTALARLDFEILHLSITFLAEKVVFLVSIRKNEILPLLSPPGYLWKNPLFAPLLEKILPTPMVTHVNK